MKIGDRVKVTNLWCQTFGKTGTVINAVRTMSGKQNVMVRLDGGFSATYYERSLKLIEKGEEESMAKLTGFNKVAVVKQGYGNYHYAIYDDGVDYMAGDKVIVSGDINVKTIDNIISVEEARQIFSKDITAEVVCLVDTTAYDNRVEKRKKAAEIRKEMDKLIKEMDEVNKYDMYAKNNPKLAEMLEEYKKIV